MAVAAIASRFGYSLAKEYALSVRAEVEKLAHQRFL